MIGKVLLFLTLSGVWSLSSCEVLRKFYYVTEKKTWADAQSYCRNNYHDLASLLTMEDISSLLKNPQLHMDRPNAAYAWIGLYDDPGKWTWSLNGAEHKDTHYTNWGEGQPDNYHRDQICTFIDGSSNHYWRDYFCRQKFASVCYDGSAYFLQTTKRTWFEAQGNCSDQNMDLASVMDETAAAEIAKKQTYRAVWIGLYRKPWAYWSDQQSATFTHWGTGHPFEPKGNPIPPQHKARLTVKISSDGADVNDPEVQRQLLLQVHATMEKQGISTCNLQWTQRDGSIFHKEMNKKN